jgi:DUF917 family protein
MGAPVIGIERLKRGDEALNAMRALERHIARPFTHVIPGEIGGANAINPMIVAAQSGLPVIDGDGMGRAFPELQMDTFSIDGIPAAPGAICDIRGHVTIFDGFSDPVVLERYARAVTIEMGGSAGYAFPVMTGAEVKRTAIPHTISLAVAIGDAVLSARQKHENPVDAVLSVSGGRRLFAGKVVDIERRLSGGFARGVVTIDGIGDDQGRQLTIDLQNEYLIARAKDGEILAIVPDLICLVDADTADPITTEVIRYGLRVVVLGMPAPDQLKTPAALAVVGPKAFGYEVEFVPLPGTYGCPQKTEALAAGR